MMLFMFFVQEYIIETVLSYIKRQIMSNNKWAIPKR